ncbi:restriction endonuclease subunit S [Mucilaginibacter polytrichastri]|uniref:Type I restriction modification DNA specificity domain-containing protein n=1 Tax=Mucilaginibacter polytrichastri TaxID=1302689 RepID=A0A1Q5ZS83_9SPHI|nr:restriction endonuclease subunit S [Mucilaginibacter polytrichastri]OKS84625.1 hypothetical protein RG47T_0057 [Mucilaginibacter polytrichastri]SFT02214.1 Type I restriction modification DNA specificity domain-containing protein [Mucilaginibacter polytrichastri]
MELIELNKLFSIQYGNQFDLYKLQFDGASNINFVSRSSQNLGVVAKVSKFKEVRPFAAGLITVTLGGTYLLSSFVQPSPFYTAQNVKVLTPLNEMSFSAKLFYCKAIEANRFKYTSHGREANTTLDTLLLPLSVPENFLKIDIEEYNKISKNSFLKEEINIFQSDWGDFKYENLFEIKKGKRLTKENFISGDTPFIGAIDSNNGYREYIGQPAIHKANTITVNYNGSVGEAFYQPHPFWASDDVNVLYPKFKMNKFSALFIITLIRKERYRFNFGRKWEMERMRDTTIKLPIDTNGSPDWGLIENYIKSLPFSKSV